MRTAVILAFAAPVAFATASCGNSNRANAANDVDLQRDLKLAATGTIQLAAPAVNPANFDGLETAPLTAPKASHHLQKSNGPKAVASKSPDLRASLIPQVATTDHLSLVKAVAVVPAPNNDPVATLPQQTHTPSAAETEAGGADRGGSVFGGLGPGIGVVIRGGGVGGDNCEPHGRGGAPGIYLPPPGGIGSVTRFPSFPRGGIH